MDTIFMNSKNSETSDPRRLLLNLADIKNLKRNDKHVALSNLAFNMHKKYKNSHTKIINLKYRPQHEMKSLSHLMDHILYQIFKISLDILRKHGEKTNNLSIRKYINKIENSLSLSIKAGYYPERLAPKTMKLLGNDKSKIKAPHLEITEVVLYIVILLTTIISKI